MSDVDIRSHGGPHLGVAGYGSMFTRYSPSFHGSDHWGHHGYSHFGHGWREGHGGHFSLGFGFYNSCYAYPAYPLAYYPTYYYPMYSAAVVPAPVVVQQPVVSYYPSDGTVSTGQYATADAYAAGTGSVPAPDVSYAAGQDESSQNQVPQAEVPQTQVPQAPAPGAAVENNMPSYSQSVPPSSAYSQAPVMPPTTVTPPPPAESSSSEVQAPADTPQAEAVAPGRVATDKSTAAAPELAMPAEKLQQLMVNGTQAFSEGRYVESVDSFGQVSKADPQNIDAALACGVAQFATGKYDAAAESIRRGVSLFPPIVDSVFDLRERYKKVSDFVDQSRKLEEFVNKNPKNDDALLVLGFVRHFSNQRDLARQAFEQIKKGSPKDAPLADTFLNAMTPEAAEAAAKAAGAAAQAPADIATTQPSAVSVTTQPAGVDAIRTGPANSEVLSVTTRPANTQTVELPADPVFKGQMSLQGDLPREQPTIDGIIVRLKGTDDDPPKASMEILAGDKRLKVSNFQPGARVQVQGESGQMYRLVLTEVNNQTETVGFLIAK